MALSRQEEPGINALIRSSEKSEQPLLQEIRVYTRDAGEAETIILVYVDDILVFSRDLKQIEEIEAHLRSSFELKSLGNLQRCLGLDFKTTEREISLNQSTYTRSVLKRFGMEPVTQCPRQSPLEPG